MDELDASSKHPTIVKANSLIQAGYRLTLAEQRVLLSAIAHIGKDDEPTDQTMYSVTANALADLTGSAAQQAYRELADAAHRLYRREVRIEGGANGDEKGPKGKRVTMTRWVQSIDYVPDEGHVKLRFSKDILPYLSLLKREFTSYKLQHVMTMRSTHGVRLYELLSQWRQAGEREIEIDEIKRMFGVEGCYKSTKDLKARVIEPAVRDVNECSDLMVDWGQRKAGRRIAAIQFTFKPKKQPRADNPAKQSGGRITEEKINAAARPGEYREDVICRLENEGRGRDNRGPDSNEPVNRPDPGREHKDAPEQVAKYLEAMRAAAKGAGGSSAGNGE